MYHCSRTITCRDHHTSVSRALVTSANSILFAALTVGCTPHRDFTQNTSESEPHVSKFTHLKLVDPADSEAADEHSDRMCNSGRFKADNLTQGWQIWSCRDRELRAIRPAIYNIKSPLYKITDQQTHERLTIIYGSRESVNYVMSKLEDASRARAAFGEISIEQIMGPAPSGSERMWAVGPADNNGIIKGTRFTVVLGHNVICEVANPEYTNGVSTCWVVYNNDVVSWRAPIKTVAQNIELSADARSQYASITDLGASR